MKKRKLLISPAIVKTSEKIAAEVNKRMAMNDAEKFVDEHCARLVPCCICKAGGNEIRKAFVPVDVALKVAKNGIRSTSLSVSICARCMARLIDEDLIYQVLNNNDLRGLL